MLIEVYDHSNARGSRHGAGKERKERNEGTKERRNEGTKERKNEAHDIPSSHSKSNSMYWKSSKPPSARSWSPYRIPRPSNGIPAGMLRVPSKVRIRITEAPLFLLGTKRTRVFFWCRPCCRRPPCFGRIKETRSETRVDSGSVTQGRSGAERKRTK